MGHCNALCYDSVFWGESELCICVCALGFLQFSMLCDELTIDGVNLCGWLWMGIVGCVSVLQGRSRRFVALIFPVSQVFALQGEAV